MTTCEGQQASAIRDHDPIRAQQQEMKELLKEIPAAPHQHPGSQDHEGLQSLIQQNATLDHQLEDERRQHRKLQEEVSSAELGLEALRKEVVRGSSASQRQKTRQAIRTLEHKLHRASVELNVQVGENRRLGEELQTLWNERTSFQQLHHKLSKELRDVQKKIRDVESVCSAAEHARAEVQSKMAVTQERKEEELSQTKAEILKLRRVIALKMTIRDFTAMKSSGRSGLDRSFRVTQRKSSKKTQKTGDSGGLSLDALTEAFEKVQAAMGVDDLADLVNDFIKNEQKICEQNSFLDMQLANVTTHRELCGQIRAEIESLRAEHLQQKEALSISQRSAEEQRGRLESQTEDCERRCVRISNILDDFKIGLHNIPLTSAWKQFTEIPEDDTAALLSLLEQIANDLLAVQKFHALKKQEQI